MLLDKDANGYPRATGCHDGEGLSNFTTSHLMLAIWEEEIGIPF
jgi:hypothetical protein